MFLSGVVVAVLAVAACSNAQGYNKGYGASKGYGKGYGKSETYGVAYSHSSHYVYHGMYKGECSFKTVIIVINNNNNNFIY